MHLEAYKGSVYAGGELEAVPEWPLWPIFLYLPSRDSEENTWV